MTAPELGPEVHEDTQHVPVEPSWRRSAIGCFSFVLVLAAVLAGIVGAIIYEDSSASHGGGPMGGLNGVATLFGIVVIVVAVVVAVIAFVVGCALFIGSAKD